MSSHIREKLCLVQFLHPGKEHVLTEDEKRKGVKNWNQGKHKRKFLKNPGEYLTSLNASPIKDDIVFWGEWEPESKVTRVTSRLPEGPKYIHEPFYRKFRIKRPPLQNTDPFVFGKRFCYTVCQQNRKTGPTQLRYLTRGSIILFGSRIKKNVDCRKDEYKFVLDTVFVVDRFIDHNRKNYKQTLKNETSPVYEECVIKPICQKRTPGCGKRGCVKSGVAYRLYFGATYDNSVDGMFSFFPCLPYKNNPEGFERPNIRLWNKIAQKNSQGWKSLLKSEEPEVRDMRRYWDQIVEEVLDQNLFLGIYSTLPDKRR